jgi:hypothetical protein
MSVVFYGGSCTPRVPLAGLSPWLVLQTGRIKGYEQLTVNFKAANKL